MKEVVRKEIIKWLDYGIVYPMSDSTWVSPIQCVPKKGGVTVAANENNELAHKILIFQDLIKGYTRKNASPRCMMKIDLSKAYETIDWLLVKDLLKAYCFPSRFIHWIMVCLKGTSYSLLISGRVQGKFIGRKGLRQRDPISPLLFVQVMEYLTILLIQASHNKDFRFHPLCKRLKLVNLYFADDHVIFCKGSLRSVQILQEGFTKFSQAFGLLANMTKSHIYFGGLKFEDKKSILDCLNIEEGSFPLKYRGVPLRPTKWKAGDCRLIIKKIILRLHTWSSHPLSFAGRAQLIHFVLLGIRSYWMNIFLLPQSVCLPKSFGGIGFKERSKWNKVLLDKYVWANSSKQDLLWVKWMDDLRLKGHNFWEYNLKIDVSWYWRKLVKLRSYMSLADLEALVTKRKLNLGFVYNHLLQWEKVRDWLGATIWPTKFSDWLTWMDGRHEGLLQRIAAIALAASPRMISLARKNHLNKEKALFDFIRNL
ncbi:uncharacterized protein LOC133799571 [Humulus lupulus]|uniref:uncharacterized protein LOC133799571 n=1 Tax=Humulus lupulus TaxID=3486 RepID=UPI002B40FBF9|nr:uncharacterized protein LOC133799571 [Humulus lupulus]